MRKGVGGDFSWLVLLLGAFIGRKFCHKMVPPRGLFLFGLGWFFDSEPDSFAGHVPKSTEKA